MAATTASKILWQSLSSSVHLISRRYWQRPPLVLPRSKVQGKLSKTVRPLPAVHSANLCKKKLTARKRVFLPHCFQTMLPDSERDESGPLYLGGSGFQLQHSQKGRATNVEEALLIRSSTRMHESLQPFLAQSFSSRRSRSSIASCQMNNHSSNSLHNQVDGTHVLPSSLCDSLASATELRPQSVQPMDSASAPLVLGQSSSTELSEASVSISPRNSTNV